MARGWRIQHKLLLGVVLTVCVLGLVLAGTLRGLWSYYQTVNDVRAKLGELKSAEQLRGALARLVSPGSMTRLADAPDRLLEPLSQARARLREYTAELDELSNSSPDPRDLVLERELAAALGKDLQDLENALGTLLAPRLQTPGEPSGRDAYILAAQGICERLDRDSRDLRDKIHEDLDRHINVSRRNYQVSLWIIVPASTVGLLLMTGLMRAFYGWVFHPIRDLREGVSRIGEGTLDVRVKVESGDEMEELASAFNAMMARLQEHSTGLERQVAERSRQLVRSERLASVGFLAAGVAHEINNPLASIAFCAEALESRLRQSQSKGPGADDAEIFQRYLSMIQEEAFRCKNITEKLLAFSRGGEKARERTDLGKLIQSVLDSAQHLPVSRGKRMELDTRDAAGLTAWTNPEEIKQVVLNLVVNGLESMDDGGVLTIRLGSERGMARLVFEDTGCGMDQATLDNIFEPFFTRNRTGSGTGLGLTITHRIVQQHGGEIEADSAGPGRGSRFVVRLPRQALEGGPAQAGADNQNFKGPRLAA